MGRALLAGAVALGIVALCVFGFGKARWKRSPPLAPGMEANAVVHPSPRADEAAAGAAGQRPVVPSAVPLPAPVVVVRPDLAPIPLATGAMPAEVQIEAIAQRSDVPDRLKARTLIQMLPGLPEEVLALATEEATTRLPDADYETVLLPVACDPATHGAAMSVIFADLLERPDAIALPALLAIARQPAHPFSATAQENLELLLGANFANDWPRWEAEIRQHLTPRR